MKKDAVVIHSGGMDSSICLALALRDFGREGVLSLSFSYGQRHAFELEQAEIICRDWGVDHVLIQLDCLREITANSLTHHGMKITCGDSNKPPNTLVVGRNGLMARLGAIHAQHLGARRVYMGVIEVEQSNSGYRDCGRDYMDLMERILRIDLDDPDFLICTPLVRMTKLQTMELASELGVLDYLLEETITCYQGIRREGCRECPACMLRNEGIRQFRHKYPDLH